MQGGSAVEIRGMERKYKYLTHASLPLGYLHPPHDGAYTLSATAGDNVCIMLATDGKPDNKVRERGEVENPVFNVA